MGWVVGQWHERRWMASERRFGQVIYCTHCNRRFLLLGPRPEAQVEAQHSRRLRQNIVEKLAAGQPLEQSWVNDHG